MMLWQPTTLLGALLAMVPAVQAGGLGALIVEGMTRDSPAYHRRMEEIMGSYLLRRGFLEERQAELSASSVGQDPIFTADGTLNMTAWNAQVNAACISTLRELKQASNPSGTCVCYNLPALDNSTGVFEADLRLFRISDARDSFAGIAPEKISVGLRFTGANVRTANPDQPVAGASQASLGAAAAAAASTTSQAETASPSSGAVGAASVGRVGGSGDGEAANRLAVRQTVVQDLPSNGDPTLLQQYLLVGKIDADKMTGQMTMYVPLPIPNAPNPLSTMLTGCQGPTPTPPPSHRHPLRRQPARRHRVHQHLLQRSGFRGWCLQQGSRPVGFQQGPAGGRGRDCSSQEWHDGVCVAGRADHDLPGWPGDYECVAGDWHRGVRLRDVC